MALEELTRCLAAELGSKGHTVNAMDPGLVQTEPLEEVRKELVEMQKKTTPAENRLGTTDDIAHIVRFLVEKRTRWVLGQSILASWGYCMY